MISRVSTPYVPVEILQCFKRREVKAAPTNEVCTPTVRSYAWHCLPKMPHRLLAKRASVIFSGFQGIWGALTC